MVVIKHTNSLKKNSTNRCKINKRVKTKSGEKDEGEYNSEKKNFCCNL